MKMVRNVYKLVRERTLFFYLTLSNFNSAFEEIFSYFLKLAVEFL